MLIGHVSILSERVVAVRIGEKRTVTYQPSMSYMMVRPLSGAGCRTCSMLSSEKAGQP